MANTKVGTIDHYYDKIAVAVVKVSNPIKVGDQIKISGHANEFTQGIDSMQIDHKEIKEAKKGDAVGMKVDQPVKAGDAVFKVE